MGVARAELRDIMGITAEPVLTQLYRWPDGHPQYDVGHLDRLAEIDGLCARYAGLYLTGSSYRGVGLPDCIYNAALVAEKAIKECVTADAPEHCDKHALSSMSEHRLRSEAP